MNLPNKLTLTRIVIVPFFVAAMLIDFPLHHLAALLLFIVASVTDMFDGKIARKQNLVTDFGKFADPLADKFLVLAALLCFVQNDLCDCVAVILLLLREFAVTSVRLLAASSGKVVAANIWGKVKTVTQMIAVIGIIAMQIIKDLCIFGVTLPHGTDALFFIAGEILIWISTFFAMLSGIIYLLENREFISDI